ncbi:hypothetical protein [Hydrogenivirga sp. 128-5-R1-1]|uniref:hypothetical protein n=1 Tax=Hydrogenivirga sp. 128-5-R1-1 TaxID=392423 RepID=UPI00015F170A|nr:hypothetical protein [Hydrogenivirga sp. 128-5-R1-1]EDP73728.1 hypothetical protein HG1285_08956 [Hydrogenivirga sp. 128-5-R1-1]
MSEGINEGKRKEIGNFVLSYRLIHAGRVLKDISIFYRDKVLVRGILDFIEVSAGVDAFLAGRMIPGERFGRFMVPEYGKGEKILLRIDLKNGDKVYLDRFEATLFNKLSRIIDKHITMSDLD